MMHLLVGLAPLLNWVEKEGKLKCVWYFEILNFHKEKVCIRYITYCVGI